MLQIKIIKANPWDWYKDYVGQTMLVLDRYKRDGVRVLCDINRTGGKDIVKHDHFQFI